MPGGHGIMLRRIVSIFPRGKTILSQGKIIFSQEKTILSRGKEVIIPVCCKWRLQPRCGCYKSGPETFGLNGPHG
jgi:hypothetical protein